MEPSPPWRPHGTKRNPWYETEVRGQPVPAGEISRLDPNDCDSSLMSNVEQMEQCHDRIRIYRCLFSTTSRKSSGCIGSGRFSVQTDSSMFRGNSGKSGHVLRTSGKRRKSPPFYQIENRELLAVLREMPAKGPCRTGGRMGFWSRYDGGKPELHHRGWVTLQVHFSLVVLAHQGWMGYFSGACC